MPDTIPPAPASPEPPEPPETPSAPSVKPPRRWFRWLGVKRRPGKRIAWGLNLWGWCLFLLVGAGVGGVAFLEYSMQPEFCRSCHLMEPYYEAWHESSHKNVPCTDCHFEPGLGNTLYGKFQASSQAVKQITRTMGSKPHAEVHDSSCMREGCHEKRLLQGKVNWTIHTSRGQPLTIHFDHKPHLENTRRGLHLRCVSCHSQIVQGQHITVTLDTCFLCHFKGLPHGRNDQTLGGCSSCHLPPKQEIKLATGVFKHEQFLSRGVTCENCHSDALKGTGDVPKQQCWTCHNQPDQIARYGDTAFVHEKHILAHKVECSSCHLKIEHRLDATIPHAKLASAYEQLLPESGTCGNCHDRLHAGPAEMFRGTGGRGVPDMPSPMYSAQVDCIACHHTPKNPDPVAQFAGQTFTTTQDRCNYCHGPKYSELLAQWKVNLENELTKAQAALAKAKPVADSPRLSGTQKLDAQRLLDDADYNVRFVKLGRGLHNPIYAFALLHTAEDYCRQALEMLPTPTPATRDAP